MTLAGGYYSINYFKPESLVELTWLPGTQDMTDQDFKESLCVFAEGALQHRAKRLGRVLIKPGPMSASIQSDRSIAPPQNDAMGHQPT